MAGGTRRHPPCGVHPRFELGETLLRNGDVRASDRTPVLLKGMEQDEKVLRTLVEDPKKPPPVVAAQLAKLAFDSGWCGKARGGADSDKPLR